MKIIIAGATGFIGSALIKKLKHKVEIVVISRDPVKAAQQFDKQTGLHFVGWDDPLPLVRDTLANSTAIVNLSGAPIAGKRWSNAYKKQIISSRIKPIEKLSKLIEQLKLKPEVVIQASATGFYAFDEEETFTESANAGQSFLSKVSQQWELAAEQFIKISPRVVLLRTGIVLDKTGGALPQMALPLKLFAGGPLGSGRQWVSWIHLEDEINAIIHLLQNPKSEGAYNLTAPNPVRQAELMKSIAKTVNRPYWMPAPAFAIKTLMGQMGDELLLQGNKVIPEKLLQEGFAFSFPTVESALNDIYKS
jgi:uncharacterized protein